MSDMYERRRKQNSRARERQRRRQERGSMAVPRIPDDLGLNQHLERGRTALAGATWLQRIRYLIQDGLWYIRNTPVVMMGIAAVVVVGFLLFVGSNLIQGRIFPNIYAFGVPIGGLTADEAKIALLQAWNNDVRIELVDGERSWLTTTGQLGLLLDVDPVIASARSVGLAGIPFGWDVEPVIETDILTMQNYLLDLALEVEVAPLNGGYEFDNGRVIGVDGREGRMLDVGLTLDVLSDNLVQVVMSRQSDLIMQPLMPEFIDPAPYIEDVEQLVSQPFQLVGYDPYYDESIAWSTTPETLISWLEAGAEGLTLREEAFAPFLEAQTVSLNASEDDEPRFLEPSETMERMRQAISKRESVVNLRVRYRPTVYTVQAGDRAFSISRRTGIPFYLIEQANPGKDLNILSPGDKLNLPSRDVAMPLDPVPNKRIIVDIDTQSLVAYENDQVVFSWQISTGIDTAPTSPGIYQILSHAPIASGGSYTLCDTQGCGQWRMHWFMGLYEVTPGLMNGFHGAVELPNGSYLGGNTVGARFTFGCVMSLNENAELLYEWAETGTPVEIISREYAPQSDLAKQAFPA